MLSRGVYMGNRANLKGRVFVMKENVAGFSYKAIMRARSLGGGSVPRSSNKLHCKISTASSLLLQ